MKSSHVKIGHNFQVKHIAPDLLQKTHHWPGEVGGRGTLGGQGGAEAPGLTKDPLLGMFALQGRLAVYLPS